MRPTAGAARTASRSGRVCGAAPRRRARAPIRARRRRGRSPRPWPARRRRAPSARRPRRRRRRRCRPRSAAAARRARPGRAPARRPGTPARAGVGQRRLGAPEREHAPPAAASSARRSTSAGSAPAKRSGAPSTRRSSPRSSALQRRREENGTWPTTRRGVGAGQPGVVDRLRVVLRDGRAGRVARERARQRRLRPRRRPAPAPTTPQRRLGQRAGLVGADDVHRGQRLDRVELLGEHAALGDLERRHRRGEADQQDQALGDEVDDPGGQRPARARAGAVDASEDGDASPTTSGIESASSQSSSRSLPARAASAGGGRPARWRSTAPRGSPDRPPSTSKSAAPSTANEPDHTGSPGPRAAGSDSPVRLASSRASPSADTTRPVGHDLIAGREAHQIARHQPVDRDRRSAPSRTTTARAQPARRAGRARAWTGSPGRSRSRCSRPGSRGRARPSRSRR